MSPGGGRLSQARESLRTDRFALGMLIIGLVALAARLAWVAYAARAPTGLYDPARYVAIAHEIARGHGYVEPFTTVHGVFAPGQASAYYPPGYPYFLGALAWLVRIGALPDDLPMVAGVVQALLGAATVWLTGVAARRLWSARAGLVAAGVLALYPNLVMHSAALLSETLFTFLFVGSLVALLVPGGEVGAPLPARRLAVAGVLFGLSVLVRPVSLAAIPFLALAWWVRGPGLVRGLRQAGWLLGCTLLLVAPWTLRNALRMHAFVPLSTNNGDNLCIGYSPDAKGVFTFSERCVTVDVQNHGSRAEVRHDHQATRLALRFLADDPGRVPWLVTRRAYYLTHTDSDGLYAVQSYGTDSFIAPATEGRLARVANDAWAVVAVLGAAGLALLVARGRRDGVVLVLGGLGLLVTPLLTFGDPRFKVPFVPVLVVGVGVLVARLTGSRPASPT